MNLVPPYSCPPVRQVPLSPDRAFTLEPPSIPPPPPPATSAYCNTSQQARPPRETAVEYRPHRQTSPQPIRCIRSRHFSKHLDFTDRFWRTSASLLRVELIVPIPQPRAEIPRCLVKEFLRTLPPSSSWQTKLPKILLPHSLPTTHSLRPVPSFLFPQLSLPQQTI